MKIPISDFPRKIPFGDRIEQALYGGRQAYSHHVHFPAEPHRLVYYAHRLACLSSENLDNVGFRTAWFGVTESGVWGLEEERIGTTIFSSIVGTHSPESWAHEFTASQFVDSICCLLQAMLVGWDAIYVPYFEGEEPSYFLFVSHDGYVDVVCLTQAAVGRTELALQQLRIETNEH